MGWNSISVSDVGLYDKLESGSVDGMSSALITYDDGRAEIRLVNGSTTLGTPTMDLNPIIVNSELNAPVVLLGFKLSDGESRYLAWRSIVFGRTATNTNFYFQVGILNLETNSFNAISNTAIAIQTGVGGSIVELKLGFGFYNFTHNQKHNICAGIVSDAYYRDGSILRTIHAYGLSVGVGLFQNYDFEISTLEVSEEYGNASEPGGYSGGSFDNSSDTIDIPSMPSLSPLSAGYFHAYYLDNPATQLVNISDAIFPSEPTAQADIIAALGEIYQALFYNRQIDFIIGCHVIPCIPTYGGNSPIRVGGRTLKTVIDGTSYELSALTVSNGYVDYDCGAISIPEYWANFLDFSNGQRCELFLPFIGYVPILNEYVVGGTLTVKYRFNVIDGSFMAYVLSTSGKSNLNNSLIGQYAGTCCLHIPMQSADYSRVISGILSTVTKTVAGVATGNVEIAGSGAISTVNSILNNHPDMVGSNDFNASSSFLSKRTPYLIIKRATSQFSQKYPEEMGLPLNVTKKLSELSGYTICADPVLNIDCTQEEYSEMVSLLKSGVIF